MVWGGRWEGVSGLGTRGHPWRMHVDVWQNQYNIVSKKKILNWSVCVCPRTCTCTQCVQLFATPWIVALQAPLCMDFSRQKWNGLLFPTLGDFLDLGKSQTQDLTHISYFGRQTLYHWCHLGGGHGNPLQYSCLENPMDRGAWQATVHGVPKSQTVLKALSMHTQATWEALKLLYNVLVSAVFLFIYILFCLFIFYIEV